MKYISLVVSLLLTGFVFSFSTASQDSSASLSLSLATNVLEILENLFPNGSWNIDSIHLFLRKTAHVGEFMLLGIAWSISFWLWKIQLRYLFAIGCIIALLDEGIQIFAEERGPSLIDVFLYDIPGFILGVGIISSFKHIAKKRNVSI